jgi:hypothetical protein
MKDSDTTTIVAALVAAYPSQTIRQPTIELYQSALADLDFNETLLAVQRIIKTSRFFPTIAEIRASVVQERLGAPSPSLAWEIVEDLIQTCYWRQHTGWEKMPDYRHELVERAVAAMGGLRDMQQSPTQSVIRGQFLRLYTDILDGQTKRMATETIGIEAAETKGLSSEGEL